MNENPLQVGLNQKREPQPFTIVIFGASGDLTKRKLIPALFSLFRGGHINHFRIIGFARRKWSEQDFRRRVAEMIKSAKEDSSPSPLLEQFLSRVSYISSSFEAEDGYKRIKEDYREPANRIYYLATPPSQYEVIIEQLGRAGLSDGRIQAAGTAAAAEAEGETEPYSRIIIEKPFGRDLLSAQTLNSKLSSIFREQQIFRIDHYLGKETVQNVMVFRFSNGFFEPVWNNRYIDHVQITMAETLGVETRGEYYEKSGALRDMVQNHLLQLLCLVAMEPPNDLHPDSIRTEKLKVLKSIKHIPTSEAGNATIRGQYIAGISGGEKVKGYREEEGVNPESVAETYVALRLLLDSWRWAGVPFYLRTGKRLARRTTEISIQFKQPPHLLFEGLQGSFSPANTLIMRIQPDEGVMLNFNLKIPGFTTKMRTVNMDFSYGSSFADELPEAYERLLLDALLGDSTLYTRSDEVEAAWSFITSIFSGWEQKGDQELFFYPAGASGPAEARQLFSNSVHKWRKL